MDMKICDKHQLILDTLKNQDDTIKVISQYHEKLDVLDNQEKIEKRKNKCQVCFFGALGRKTLAKITKTYPQKKVQLILNK